MQAIWGKGSSRLLVITHQTHAMRQRSGIKTNRSHPPPMPPTSLTPLCSFFLLSPSFSGPTYGLYPHLASFSCIFPCSLRDSQAMAQRRNPSQDEHVGFSGTNSIRRISSAERGQAEGGGLVFGREGMGITPTASGGNSIARLPSG